MSARPVGLSGAVIAELATMNQAQYCLERLACFLWHRTCSSHQSQLDPICSSVDLMRSYYMLDVVIGLTVLSGGAYRLLACGLGWLAGWLAGCPAGVFRPAWLRIAASLCSLVLIARCCALLSRRLCASLPAATQLPML